MIVSHRFDAEGGTAFHHNSDFSGDVSINVDAGNVKPSNGPDGLRCWVTVPFADLHEFVQQYLTTEHDD